MKTMWWAYIHSNGSLLIKRWFGDHKDYTDDCHNNPFVEFVVPPFESETREKARTKAFELLPPAQRLRLSRHS